MAIPADPGTRQTTPRSEWGSLAVSLCFWGSLGGAALLTALLILSPRIVENERLQQRLVKNARELSLLTSEVEQLASLADALADDPDFVARLAATELKSSPAGVVHVPIGFELAFDARDLPVSQAGWNLSPFWGLFIAEALASPGSLRLGCQVATVILVLISFGCFQDRLFSETRKSLHRRFQTRYRSRDAE